MLKIDMSRLSDWTAVREFEVFDILGRKCLHSMFAGVFEDGLMGCCDGFRGIGPDIFFCRDKVYRVYNMARVEKDKMFLARTDKLIAPRYFYGSVLSKDDLIPRERSVVSLSYDGWRSTTEKRTIKEFMEEESR